MTLPDLLLSKEQIEQTLAEAWEFNETYSVKDGTQIIALCNQALMAITLRDQLAKLTARN